MTDEDKTDLKNVLNEQLNYINQLIIHLSGNSSTIPPINYINTQSLYITDNILGCNKVMTEILNGPSGTVERMI